MRAVVINSFGGVEGLALEEIPAPSAPTADRVRVRVHAAGLNRADILQRRGHYPAPRGYPQNIPGLEFAGEVQAVGDAVHRWKAGDRVLGLVGGGAQAEYVVVPESNLARIPAQLNWAEAGAMPEVFITAHDALVARAGLQMGEHVLVHAAASGVGTAAVQLAHVAGARVYGTSRNSEKLNRLHELQLGLDESVAVGDAPEKFLEMVRKWTNGTGVNVIIDLVGGSYFPANVKALAPRGRLICIGTTAGPKAEVDLGLIMRKCAAIIGTALRNRSTEEKADVIHRFASAVVPLVAHGRIRPVIDRVYPADQVREAHARMESNASVGKIVLMFS